MHLPDRLEHVLSSLSTNGSPGSPDTSAADFDIWDQCHSSPSHIRVIHVGAGAAGLLAAYKARRMLKNYSLVCYERNPSIGGTWWENRYPGCACDIPAHTYTYPFEPNPDWSGYYAHSYEIQEYFERFYEKYELAPFVKLNTEVVSAAWDEDEGKWNVALRSRDSASGETKTFQDWCHVLINGSGVLSKWKWPDIEGLHDFQGQLTHSAAWDLSTDATGKRVAVIGTGSSSIQIVPQLAEKASQLTVFMRNVTWISPMFAADEQAAAEDGEKPAPAGKHWYTRREKERFRNDPEFHLQYRKDIEGQMGQNFAMFLRGTELNAKAKHMMREQMLQRIGPGHEQLKEKLIPSWSPGCRRLTPGESYLEALTRPNVSTVHEEIVRIKPHGLVVASGKEIQVDILACATGFEVAYVPHFTIIGAGGVVMQEEWAEEPNIYLSVAAPRYPNYFVVNGPRGNWGHGCILPSHEVQIEYIMQCVQKMQEEGIKSMEPKQKPTTDFNIHMDSWHNRNSVWAEDCKR
jgi:cation diffusion facilitator CzcD-associated flavoprotein CzcO